MSLRQRIAKVSVDHFFERRKRCVPPKPTSDWRTWEIGICTVKPDRNALAAAVLIRPAGSSVDWAVSGRPVAYAEAVAAMEARAAAIFSGIAAEAVWLVEHPPLYTAGTSARAEDLLAPNRFPVFRSGRGGEYTYHGPGQRVAYVMLDLNRRGPDLRRYVAALESWVIATLARFGVSGERREDRVGVWVRRPDKPALPDGRAAEDKIAAIGIRVRRWVSFHGVSLNVDPDLAHYSGIRPCGVSDYGVTSLADLGARATLPEVDAVLREEFERVFGSATNPADVLTAAPSA